MNWVYKILMAAAAVSGGLITGGILPATYAVIPTIIGTVAGILHTVPGTPVTTVGK
jgi:hypothetical protein